jgi:hypothetical protein
MPPDPIICKTRYLPEMIDPASAGASDEEIASLMGR